jgi:hypothetical protein
VEKFLIKIIFHHSDKLDFPKLGVSERPDGNRMYNLLIKSPPSIENAQKWFEFFSSNLAHFEPHHLRNLRTAFFIPVNSNVGVRYHSPAMVYFQNELSKYKNCFVFVNFGEVANQFLQACGVNSEPSPVEIAQSLVENPERFLNGDFENYLSLLRQVAANFDQIKRISTLVKQMKNTNFLAAVHYVEDTDGKTKQKYWLARPEDIYLIDEIVLAQLFQPLGCL